MGALILTACASQMSLQKDSDLDELTQVCDLHQGKLVAETKDDSQRLYCVMGNKKIDAITLKNQLAKIMIQGDSITNKNR